MSVAIFTISSFSAFLPYFQLSSFQFLRQFRLLKSFQIRNINSNLYFHPSLSRTYKKYLFLNQPTRSWNWTQGHFFRHFRIFPSLARSFRSAHKKKRETKMLFFPITRYISFNVFLAGHFPSAITGGFTYAESRGSLCFLAKATFLGKTSPASISKAISIAWTELITRSFYFKVTFSPFYPLNPSFHPFVRP